MRRLPFFNRLPLPHLAPVRWITGYYIILFSIAALLMLLVPSLQSAISGQRLAELTQGGAAFSFGDTSPLITSEWLTWRFSISLGVAMVGAFMLMIPVTWVYMAVKRRKGMDQTLIQTIVILAVTVAGVVMVVRNSVALAFSLAGIVGAVRFRNSLKDTQDTLYIFLSIGIGLTAGVEALAAAAVLSVLFNYLVLLLWGAEYGYCELGHNSGHLLLTSQKTEPAIPAVKEPKPFNAVVRVRARAPEVGAQVLEPFLAKESKRWILAGTSPGVGEVVLTYLARLKRRTNPEDVEDAILSLGGNGIIGARITWRDV